MKNSYLEYLFEHGYIPLSEIQLNEMSNDEGKSIANKLKVRFLGFWEELGKYIFNDDDVTQSSFTAGSMDEAIKKLQHLRVIFHKV